MATDEAESAVKSAPPARRPPGRAPRSRWPRRPPPHMAKPPEVGHRQHDRGEERPPGPIELIAVIHLGLCAERCRPIHR